MVGPSPTNQNRSPLLNRSVNSRSPQLARACGPLVPGRETRDGYTRGSRETDRDGFWRLAEPARREVFRRFGKIRDHEVRIRGSKHQPPGALEVRPMLREILRWARRSSKTVHPVELASTFHFRFEFIHPFGDGNGRIGRLAVNVILTEAGYPPLNIQSTKRRGYYHALERASSIASPGPFTIWFFRRYLAINRQFAKGM